jgi:hypothetical protein
LHGLESDCIFTFSLWKLPQQLKKKKDKRKKKRKKILVVEID